MKRTIFICATILFALTLATAGAFVPSKKSTATAAAATPQKEVPVTIKDQKGRALKVESLPRETQSQIERIKGSVRNLQGSGAGGSENLTIHVDCTYPPLHCHIDILF